MRCSCPRTPSDFNRFVTTRIRCTRERARRSRILLARKRPGLRKDPGLFVFHLQLHGKAWQPNRGDRWIAPPGNGRRGCSVTIQREAFPMRVGTNASLHAGVAQQAARNVANVEATGSIPVVRSISGVPVHKHRAGPVCMCAGAAAPACSESPGLRVARVRTQPRWKFHALVARRAEQPPRVVNSEARVPPCLGGSRGFEPRTTRQITQAVVLASLPDGRVRTQRPACVRHPLVAELADAPGSEPGVERRVRSNRTEGTSSSGSSIHIDA